MFKSLNTGDMAEFLTKIESFSSFADALKSITSGDAKSYNAKGLSYAGELISGFASRLIATDASDGKSTLAGAFASLLTEVGKHDSEFNAKGKAAGEKYAVGFGKTDDAGSNPKVLNSIFDEIIKAISGYESQFFDKGKKLGEKFVEGFKNEKGVVLINRHSEFVKSITDTITQIINQMDNYLEDYKGKGKSAGEYYASGFQQGLEESGMGSLTPIIAMDSNGNTATGIGLKSILTEMGLATSTDIGTLCERLDTINLRFDSAITSKLDQINSEYLKNISDQAKKLEKLTSISEKVNSIDGHVNDLKVYVFPNKLVAAIGDEIDKYLGDKAKKV